MSLDRRVLIADDDAAHRSGVAEFLAEFDLEILEAEDGGQALSILRGGPLDLALLDHRMPEHTGLDLLTLARNELIHVPCILCSAEVDETLERRAREAGAAEILRKPIRPLDLRNVVLRLLSLPPPPL